MLTIKHFFIAFVFFMMGYTMPDGADATGGAGLIAEKVMSQLEDVKTYLNEGDTKSALEEIDNAIKELKDTYEADQ